MKKHFAVLAVALSCYTTSFTNAARANDGSLEWGGSPQLLSSHPNVAMQSEVITMNIGAQNVTVDCRFVFKNHGKATTVRMGFPDEGSGATAFEADSEDPKPKTAPTGFTSFKSWVDGAPTKTTAVRSSRSGLTWHTKSVRFPAQSTRIVRDLYTVPIGGQMGAGMYYRQASYTLHTGASWRGPIGRSEIIVNFVNTGGADVLRPTTIEKLKAEHPAALDWKTVAKGTVIYIGPSAPSVNGRTLRWVRTNWNPTKKDDIFLAFNPVGTNGQRLGN